MAKTIEILPIETSVSMETTGSHLVALFVVLWVTIRDTPFMYSGPFYPTDEAK